MSAIQLTFWFSAFLLLLTDKGVISQNEDSNSELVLPKSYSNLRIPTRRRRPESGPDSSFHAASPPGPPGRPGSPGMPQAPPGPGGFGGGGGFREELPDINSSTVRSINQEDDLFPALSPPYRPDPETSDRKLHPDDSDPLQVDVNVQIQSVREIDELNEKLILDVDLTLHWKDYAYLPEQDGYTPEPIENITYLLGFYENEPLSLAQFEQLWKPDVVVERVVKIQRPELLSKPISVRAIRETSSIIYSTRVAITVDCSMSFEYYPADSQHCFLNLRSYQNDNTTMNLRWNPLPGAYLVTTESDDNFDVQLSSVETKLKRVKDINLNDAFFTVLRMKISMRRKMSYHLVQTYIPSSFLVFITWLSFLIPEDLIEARIGVSMTTLLTLTAMFSAVRENTPIVSYVKAIDIWMVYCIFIVFSTLLEFTFFVWLRDYKKSQRERRLQRMMDLDPNVPKPNKKPYEQRRSPSAQLQSIEIISSKAVESFEKTARLFNRFAFVVFVLIFIIFNIIYWPWLLVTSEHFQWNVNSTLNGHDEDDDYLVDEL